MPRRHSMSVHRTPSWQTEAAEVTTAALQLRIQNLERRDFLPERRALRAKYKPQIKKAALKKAEAARCRAIVEAQLEGSSAIDPVVLDRRNAGLLSGVRAGKRRAGTRKPRCSPASKTWDVLFICDPSLTL
ncbi:hypothetical protein DIPPA_29527 [Diplonema papillatum]|nr:hypothetical protein DIPPA_29527 [Diplonema papillatum]